MSGSSRGEQKDDERKALWPGSLQAQLAASPFGRQRGAPSPGSKPAVQKPRFAFDWTKGGNGKAEQSLGGMLAGWGLGNAFSELFSEIRTEYSEVVCAPPPYDGAALDCTMLDMGLASLLTLGATLIVTHVQPLTQGLQFGDGVVRARAGASLRAGAAQPPAQLSFTRLGAP